MLCHKLPGRGPGPPDPETGSRCCFAVFNSEESEIRGSARRYAICLKISTKNRRKQVLDGAIERRNAIDRLFYRQAKSRCIFAAFAAGQNRNLNRKLAATGVCRRSTRRMPASAKPRIAILGFSIECNKFAPPATKAHFLAKCYLEGEAILAEAHSPTPTMLPEIPGFVAAMDRVGSWSPVGIALAMTEPNGPVEHGFFEEFVATVTERLKAALPVDGVYFCAHGAAITTAEDDPEGVLFERVRQIVGPDVPVVATFDLHANVSDRMVQEIDAFIGYRTNPHLDMRERGEEAAAVLHDLLAGAKTERVRLRLPVVPPTVTMLTAAGPYAEMIALGQRRQGEIGPDIVNVSVMGGFAYGDTAKNGLSVIVTARQGKRAAAEALAREIAAYGWEQRARFYPKLTALDEAVAKAGAVGADPSLPALIFADVADNPGGGGRGNTMFLLRALHEAGVEGALVGIIY